MDLAKHIGLAFMTTMIMAIWTGLQVIWSLLMAGVVLVNPVLMWVYVFALVEFFEFSAKLFGPHNPPFKKTEGGDGPGRA